MSYLNQTPSYLRHSSADPSRLYGSNARDRPLRTTEHHHHTSSSSSSSSSRKYSTASNRDYDGDDEADSNPYHGGTDMRASGRTYDVSKRLMRAEGAVQLGYTARAGAYRSRAGEDGVPLRTGRYGDGKDDRDFLSRARSTKMYGEGDMGAGGGERYGGGTGRSARAEDGYGGGLRNC